jgi:hypothetical protein
MGTPGWWQAVLIQFQAEDLLLRASHIIDPTKQHKHAICSGQKVAMAGQG